MTDFKILSLMPVSLIRLLSDSVLILLPVSVPCSVAVKSTSVSHVLPTVLKITDYTTEAEKVFRITVLTILLSIADHLRSYRGHFLDLHNKSSKSYIVEGVFVLISKSEIEIFHCHFFSFSNILSFHNKITTGT